jgi:hypothetical protein
MSSGWAQILTSVLSVVGAGGGLGAVFTAILRRRATDAEAADVITDTALVLVEPLKQRIRDLENEVRQLQRAVKQALEELRRLRMAVLDPAANLEDLRTLVYVAQAPD